MSQTTKEHTMYFTSEGPNKITICGRVSKKGKMCFGVSRCGNNEHYQEDLGRSIAYNRSKVQKYCCMESKKFGVSKIKIQKGFNLIAQSIVSHVESSKQWSPNLTTQIN